jgi:hypothetical protein
MTRAAVRIGCSSGFWGDSAWAADQLVRSGQIDHLAEITMSLLARAPVAPRSSRPPRPLSINAYLGAQPIAAALEVGADIMLTGRRVDSVGTLGILMHEFGWRGTEHDLLAAGSLGRGPLLQVQAYCQKSSLRRQETHRENNDCGPAGCQPVHRFLLEGRAFSRAAGQRRVRRVRG